MEGDSQVAKKTEFELRLLLVQKESELKLQQKESELRLLQKESELQQKESELRLLQKESELQLREQEFRYKIEKLTHDLENSNWEIMRQSGHISIREFLNEIERKYMDPRINRRQRYGVFGREHRDLLALWQFTPEKFEQAASNFYSRMCEAAHPDLQVEKEWALPECSLLQDEWRVFGFLWEQYPLPIENLNMCQPNGSLVCVSSFKKVKN